MGCIDFDALKARFQSEKYKDWLVISYFLHRLCNSCNYIIFTDYKSTHDVSVVSYFRYCYLRRERWLQIRYRYVKFCLRII